MEQHYVTPPRGIVLKFQGIIDLNELYRQMKLWLEDKSYIKETSFEKKYAESSKPNGKQIEIRWEGGKTINDYIKYKIKVNFILLGINEVESEKDGVKRKLYKGNFQIYIIGWIEEGGESWDNLGVLTKLYHKLIEKRRIEDNISDLYGKIYSFQNYIRKFLEVRT